MSANNRRFSGTIEMPRRTISDVGSPEIVSPSKITSPSHGTT